MAEEVKKTPKPRKPRAPKAPKEALEALEKFEEEIKKEEPVVEEAPEVEEPEQKVPEEEQKPLDIPVTEPQSFDVETLKPVDPVPEVEEPELPKPVQNLTPSFREFSTSLKTGQVSIQKLNPNLPDAKSKWVAQIPYGNNLRHILFKGSYAKAYQAAANYNKARGIEAPVEKIRSN